MYNIVVIRMACSLPHFSWIENLGDVVVLGLRPPLGLEQLRLSLLDHRTELQAKLFPLFLGPTEVAQLAEPPLREPFATSIRSSSTFGLHRLQEVHHLLDLLMLLLLGPEELGVLSEQLGHGLHSGHRRNCLAYAGQTKQIRKPRSATMQDGYALIFLEPKNPRITAESGPWRRRGLTVTSAPTPSYLPKRTR